MNLGPSKEGRAVVGQSVWVFLGWGEEREHVGRRELGLEVTWERVLVLQGVSHKDRLS